MNDVPGELGRRVAFNRKKRGLSQRQLAGLIDRSESWVSQLERGVITADRMSLISTLAAALKVPLSELASVAPVIAAASERPEPAVPLRLLLSSSQALSAVLRAQPPPDLAPLRTAVRRAWDLAHESRYAELTELLTDLLPRLESGTRSASSSTRQELFALLAKADYACAAALARLGQSDGAWVAADRGVHAAERAGDPLLMAEGAFRLTLVFQSSRQFDLAERTARTAIEALAEVADAGDAAALSIRGALFLQLAIVAARQNQPDAAYAAVDRAMADAERIGVDRNDYDTEFGPTNAALQAVAVAVELGDAGRALHQAAQLDASALSPERRSRLLLDVARAHLQRRSPRPALQALLDAEGIAPETVRHHRLARNLIVDLLGGDLANDPELKALATRTGDPQKNY